MRRGAIKHVLRLLVDPETGKMVDVAQAAVELTPRESQILFSLACGETIKDIAHAIGVRPATVSAHAKHLREGLNIHTQALLTCWAMTYPEAAVAGTAVGIWRHRKGCPCSAPFCMYRRIGKDVVIIPRALTSAQVRGLLRTAKLKAES